MFLAEFSSKFGLSILLFSAAISGFGVSRVRGAGEGQCESQSHPSRSPSLRWPPLGSVKLCALFAPVGTQFRGAVYSWAHRWRLAVPLN